jgi:hypothetical protein
MAAAWEKPMTVDSADGGDTRYASASSTWRPAVRLGERYFFGATPRTQPQLAQ